MVNCDACAEVIIKNARREVSNKFFIVMYFIRYLQKSLTLSVISILLVVGNGNDPLSRGYQPRALPLR